MHLVDAINVWMAVCLTRESKGGQAARLHHRDAFVVKIILMVKEGAPSAFRLAHMLDSDTAVVERKPRVQASHLPMQGRHERPDLYGLRWHD